MTPNSLTDSEDHFPMTEDTVNKADVSPLGADFFAQFHLRTPDEVNALMQQFDTQDSSAAERRKRNDEFGRIADEVYETRVRPIVETDENIGKMLVMDIETGAYDIDEINNSMALRKRMLAKYPAERLAGFRIGYDALHAFGGYRPMPRKR